MNSDSRIGIGGYAGIYHTIWYICRWCSGRDSKRYEIGDYYSTVQILTEEQSFPLEAKTNDVFVTKDYEYRYNNWYDEKFNSTFQNCGYLQTITSPVLEMLTICFFRLQDVLYLLVNWL